MGLVQPKTIANVPFELVSIHSAFEIFLRHNQTEPTRLGWLGLACKNQESFVAYATINVIEDSLILRRGKQPLMAFKRKLCHATVYALSC